MNWRSTFELLQLCFILVARIAIITLTFICFLLISVAFDWVIKWALGLLGASEIVENALSQITLAYVLTIAMAGTLTSAVVVGYLTYTDLRNTFSEPRDTQSESDDYAE